MIVQLTGTLIEASPSHVVLDVCGVGYEMRCSAQTAASLPAVGEAGVTLLTRLNVRDTAVSLFGFASREERALFDRLVAISGVGPSLALSVLSTFSPSAFAGVVLAGDVTSMATVPGVGKKLATRLVTELQDAFAKDANLIGLAGSEAPAAAPKTGAAAASTVEQDVEAALLSMGFSPQEIEVALAGHEEAGATTVEAAVGYALRRLGGGA